MNIGRLVKVLYYTVILGMLASTFVFAQDLSAPSAAICNVVNQVRGVVGVISLLLFIVGGTLYAVAHFMPAAGNVRGNLQGWSIGMIIGGVVGLILVLIAPSILTLIVSSASAVGTTGVTC